jgi:transcriptional regulator with XRE-family HTH domain
MNLGTAIRTARLSANWTGAELAERTGLSPASISLIERGDRSASMQTAEIIAKALGMPLWALMKLAEDQSERADKVQEIQKDLIKTALVLRHRTKMRTTAKVKGYNSNSNT